LGRIACGRRIAILGDMLELGPRELTYHADVARHPAIETTHVVHCVGPRMAALWQALPAAKQGQQVDSAEELAAQVHHILDAGDVVLVKGSKGSRVSLVVDAIRKLGQTRSDVTG
jgi:UDP-N-acetylmuramoyl-tripeptide--D-alanyl-D-alanine ligase